MVEEQASQIYYSDIIRFLVKTNEALRASLVYAAFISDLGDGVETPPEVSMLLTTAETLCKLIAQHLPDDKQADATHEMLKNFQGPLN